jgi:hypothetical protein
MPTIARGMVNALVNRNEDRVSREVYDLYCFLRQHPTISDAPNRLKDILRASVNYTAFGYIFGGLVSRAAADIIDARLKAGQGEDPCAGIQRDHFHTWKETADFLLAQPVLAFSEFWSELKRRNEVVLLLKEEHAKVGGLQRMGHGHQAYPLAGINLVRVDVRAIKLSGNKAGLVREHWPPPAQRAAAALASSPSNAAHAQVPK